MPVATVDPLVRVPPAGAPRETPEASPRISLRAAVSGAVRDATGEPVVGAQVCALTSSPLLDSREAFKPACAVTGRDGHYRISGLWPVRYSVSASAPGHVPAFHVRGEHATNFDPVHLRPGSEARDIDVVLRGGGVQIHGEIKDLSGGAIEDAIVTSGGLFYRTGMAVTTSGPEGKFSLWVRPGTPQVWARAEGYAGGSDAGAAPGHSFELFLTPEAVLIGKVVRAGSGAPVEGARVTAQRGDTWFGGSTGAAITDASGNFRLAQLTPGAYKARVEADDAFGMAAEQVVLGLGETSASIVIEAHPAVTVEGRVVVTGGASCPDGSVDLHDAASGRAAAAELEADGLARMPGLLPGTYGVTVRCPGFMTADRYEPVVVADRPITGLRWDVAPGRAIRGTVLTAKGEPVAAISVAARVKAGPGMPAPRTIPSVDTDTRGRFEIPALLPGAYDLRMYTTGAGRAISEQPVEVTLPEGQDLEDIRLELLASGEVRGEVRDVHGAPLARAEVSLQAPGRRAARARTGDDGSFHVPEAAAGEYRAIASRDGVKLRAPGSGDDDVQGVKVAIEAGTTATVKLVVETGTGQLVGVVREASGGVASDAFIEASRESESAVGPRAAGGWASINQRPHLTDSEGRFAIDGLFPGKYTVRAFRRGGGEATVEHVELGTAVTLTIAETGRLAGTVALAGGGAPEEFTATLEDPASRYRRTDQFFRTGGAWSFAELPPASYKLQLAASGGTANVEVSLGTGEEKSGVRVELAAKVKLRGTVVDLTGAPVPGLAVQISQDGTFTFDLRARPQTDAAGRFELADAPVGAVQLMISAPLGVTTEYDPSMLSVQVSGGPEVLLPPIRISRRRVKPGDAPGDLGYALKLASPNTAAGQHRLEVALVRPGGPAAIAGLQVGDTIVEVDGEDVTGERRYLHEALTHVPIGTAVRLGVARGVTLEVTSAGPP